MQFTCLQLVTWTLKSQGPAFVTYCDLLGWSFHFSVAQCPITKPLYTTSSYDYGLTVKFTLLWCKCPLKLRPVEILECYKEGKDVYEDELLAQEG